MANNDSLIPPPPPPIDSNEIDYPTLDEPEFKSIVDNDCIAAPVDNNNVAGVMDNDDIAAPVDNNRNTVPALQWEPIPIDEPNDNKEDAPIQHIIVNNNNSNNG